MIEYKGIFLFFSSSMSIKKKIDIKSKEKVPLESAIKGKEIKYIMNQKDKPFLSNVQYNSGVTKR